MGALRAPFFRENIRKYNSFCTFRGSERGTFVWYFWMSFLASKLTPFWSPCFGARLCEIDFKAFTITKLSIQLLPTSASSKVPRPDQPGFRVSRTFKITTFITTTPSPARGLESESLFKKYCKNLHYFSGGVLGGKISWENP